MTTQRALWVVTVSLCLTLVNLALRDRNELVPRAVTSAQDRRRPGIGLTPSRRPTETPTEGPAARPTEAPKEGPTEDPSPRLTEGSTQHPLDSPTNTSTESPVYTFVRSLRPYFSRPSSNWHKHAQCVTDGPAVSTFATATRRLVERNRAHIMKNVCVSSAGGLYAKFRNASATTAAFAAIGEVRRNKLRLRVAPLTTPPPCYVDRTLVLFKAEYHSLNFGHALVQVLGLRRAYEAAATSGNTTLPPVFGIAYDNVTQSLRHAGTFNALDEVLPLVSEGNHFAFPAEHPDSFTQGNETLLCFREAVFGMDAPPGFHSEERTRLFRTQPLEHRTRYLNLVGGLSRYTASILALRRTAWTYFGIDSTVATKPTKTVVTWVGRTVRGLVGERKKFEAVRAHHAHNTTLEFRYVLLETMPFAEQARVVAQTDVLIGAHGAGLMWLFLLRNGSVVLELQSDGHLDCAPAGINVGAMCPFGSMTTASRFLTHIVEPTRLSPATANITVQGFANKHARFFASANISDERLFRAVDTALLHVGRVVDDIRIGAVSASAKHVKVLSTPFPPPPVIRTRKGKLRLCCFDTGCQIC